MYNELGPAYAYANSLSPRDKAQVLNAKGHVDLLDLLGLVASFYIGLNVDEYEAYGFNETGGHGIAGLRKPHAFFNAASYKQAMLVRRLGYFVWMDLFNSG